MAKYMKRKGKRYKRKYIKNKNEKSEDNEDFEKFLVSSDELIACLRLILAKIKEDVQKGTLILKKSDLNKANENIFQNENSSTSLSLSFNKNINISHQNLIDENDDNNNNINNNNNNEHELSDININIFDFDEASFPNLLFSQNNNFEFEKNEKIFEDNKEEKNDILYFN